MSSEEQVLSVSVACASFILICKLLKNKKRNKPQKRRRWSSQLYLRRRRNNNINSTFLLNDLSADNQSEKFKNFCRMSEEDFTFILNGIRSSITKKDTSFRKAIPPEERLAITLRFLATGDSFTSLQYLFRVSKQVISVIVPEVCEAIIQFLRSYIKVSKLKICLQIY